MQIYNQILPLSIKTPPFFDEIPPFGRNDATIMGWTPAFIIFYAAVIPNEAQRSEEPPLRNDIAE